MQLPVFGKGSDCKSSAIHWNFCVTLKWFMTVRLKSQYPFASEVDCAEVDMANVLNMGQLLESEVLVLPQCVDLLPYKIYVYY